MTRPYYEDAKAGITIYHGDAREVLPGLTVDLVVTDPPYGIDKAEWDTRFPIETLELASFHSTAMAVMPGVWNLGVMPERLGAQTYNWTLSAYLSNGMTRGKVGFGNWIPIVLYSAPGVSLYSTAKRGTARYSLSVQKTSPTTPRLSPIV